MAATTRRTFLAYGVAFLAAPLAAGAQQAGKVFRIGILGNVPITESYGAALWGAFIQGLREFGYVDGQNISIEHISSEGKYERLPDLAAELVRRKVDVIVVPADQNALAVKQATRTIPIVMIGDPVGSGLVASLARPRGKYHRAVGISRARDSREAAGAAQSGGASGLPRRHPPESEQPDPSNLAEAVGNRSAVVDDTDSTPRGARA